MKTLIGKSLTTRLVSLFALATIVPIIIIAVLALRSGSAAIRDQAFAHLKAQVATKQQQVLNFLHERVIEASLLADSDNAKSALKRFDDLHETSNAPQDGPFDVASAQYKAIVSDIEPFFKEYVESTATRDVYLVDAEHGQVVYSVAMNKDLGTSLRTGPYRDSGVARVFENTLKNKAVAIEDYSEYAPSGTASAFLGVPVLDNAGAVTGVFISELSAKRLNAIVGGTIGMGESGETYLVGANLLLRSDTRVQEESGILKRKIDTEATRAAVLGQTGEKIIRDYRGVRVLSAFSPVGLSKVEGLQRDLNWSIIAEIDESEAFAPIAKLQKNVAYSSLAIVIAVVVLGFLVARGISGPILGGVGVVASSASEISVTVSQIASSSSETAASVSETNTTVDEVRQTAQLAKERAKAVFDGAQNAAHASEKGSESMRLSVGGLRKIGEQMNSITESIMKLSERSQTIGDIITSVGDLAEQSNLLAVNASIEAAKAGEQGKGFAVVAEEIRSLADQSKEATKQVRAILSDIQKATSSAVLTTEQGGKAVQEGQKLADEAMEAISTLAAAIKEAAQAATQISASSQQQLAGMEQVGNAMENIKSASVQNQTSTRQLATAAHGLQEVGENLRQLVEGQRGMRNAD